MKEPRAEEIPILMQTEYIFFGGGMESLREGSRLAQDKSRVLLAAPGTCLLPELCDTFLWQPDQEIAAFFPDEVWDGSLLQPDKTKIYLEEYCRKLGIGLLYGVIFLDCVSRNDRKVARFAAKGGMFGVECERVFLEEAGTAWQEWDYRVLLQEEGQDGFGLLTVTACAEEIRKGADGQRSAARLLHCLQEKAMFAFAQQKQENPALALGRFAPLMKPVDDRMATLTEWTDTVQSAAKTESCEVLVAGGGTAGALAALHAARGGARTVLIEPQYVLGGTSTVGGVSTYWFGNRFRAVREIDRETSRYMEQLGLPRRQGIWSHTDDFHPGVRAWVLQKLCLEAGVQIYYGQLCYGAVWSEEAEGRRLRGVLTAGDSGRIRFDAEIFLDATGDGDLAVYAGADSVYGSQRDCITYWASLAQYTGVNTYRNNFSTMVVSSDPADMTRFIIQARRRGENTFDHGRYVSMRESRHIRTERALDLRDLMRFQTYPDALYTCYSNYDPKGKLDADCVYCGILPPQVQIQIPLSALLACDAQGRRIGGLYVLGKAVGATHNVFPSIRMQPDLMHQGAVMGGLAAASLSMGLLPEQLSDAQRRRLLCELSDDPLTLPPARTDVAAAVSSLRADSRTHWVDVPFTYTEQVQAESLVVLLADEKEALPALRQRLAREKDEDTRQLLIGFCIWHGCNEDVQEYADRIKRQLAGGVLPGRKASTMCAQLLPDHGVMPELVYQLNLLGLSGAEEALLVLRQVLSLLTAQERNYQEIRDGIYHYIETFAYAAEHGGQKEWIPLLHSLLALPEFEKAADMQEDGSLITERLWILRLILCRSLARLSDEAGREALEQMLSCPCRAIRISAQKALEEWGAGVRTQKIW
ncbi:MAG: FAD-dependent oxidoreductase [Lachnospiraceae bacterium]|nr:FAD-dependent oxidoreductase [Lachnospiraceae bacterium]